jgi:hypothetical protein
MANPSRSKAAAKPRSHSPRLSAKAVLAGIVPVPQITSPTNGSTVSAGSSITIQVSTNRPDLQSIVWLLDVNGNIIDQVAVTWPTSPPFVANVVLTIPDPADPTYLIEFEQINNAVKLDGGFFVHAIQINVM